MSKPDYSEKTRLDCFATLEGSADDFLDWDILHTDPNYPEILSELLACDAYHALRLAQREAPIKDVEE